MNYESDSNTMRVREAPIVKLSHTVPSMAEGYKVTGMHSDLLTRFVCYDVNYKRLPNYVSLGRPF